MAVEQDNLALLFEKHVPSPFPADRVAYCDRYDLLAVVGQDQDEVNVYRALNGQVAFTAKYPDLYEEYKPRLVSWKTDGSLLGVAWEDGTVCLYEGEGGKLVSRASARDTAGQSEVGWGLDLNAATASAIDDEDGEENGEERAAKALVWTRHRRARDEAKHAQAKDSKGRTGVSTEDWFDEIGAELDTAEGGRASPNKYGIQSLVSPVTTLDVTSVMPGLSALPAHGLKGSSAGAKFTSQTSVDNAFSSSASDGDGIDILLVCGSSHADIYLDDSVKIGSVPLKLEDVTHASHPQCASQAVLSRSPASHTCRLNFIDLPLETLGGSLLHVIALNTKRLQSLMLYITQTVRCIQHDYESGQQLPTRILNNFRDHMQEKEEDEPTLALYGLLMSARYTAAMHEWLTDVVNDTTRKRWEQSLLDLYDHIQTHIFMHLQPALNRLSIAASTLRGHADLHEGTSTFDMPPSLLADLADSADGLRLAAERAQLVVIAEQRQFKAFIKWLRVMIDVASAGPGSKTAIEIETRESPDVDFSLTGQYIKRTMAESQLAGYIKQPKGMTGRIDKDGFFDHLAIAGLTREKVLAAFASMNAPPAGNAAPDSRHVLNLAALTARLVAHTGQCLDKITAWQQRMLSREVGLRPVSTEIRIDPQATVLDMKMFPSEKQAKQDTCTTCIVVRPAAADSSLEIITADRSINGVQSSVYASDFRGSLVLHAQIIDPQTLFALLELDSDAPTQSIYRLVVCRRNTAQSSRWSQRTLHRFGPLSLVPVRFLVGGRPGKRVILAFGVDEKSWQVLDLEGCETEALSEQDYDDMLT